MRKVLLWGGCLVVFLVVAWHGLEFRPFNVKANVNFLGQPKSIGIGLDIDSIQEISAPGVVSLKGFSKSEATSVRVYQRGPESS